MRLRAKAFFAVILLVLLVPSLGYAQQTYQLKAYDLKTEVLPATVFEARFGNNPDIPRTPEQIISLAVKLYPPAHMKPPAVQPEARAEESGCHEYELGLLFAALQNPAIPDFTRAQVDAIIIAAIPPLPRSYTTNIGLGRFTFYYTDNDPNPDHNVTYDEIVWTAEQLENGWTNYVDKGFKDPKHVHRTVFNLDRIYVKVYYLGAALHGQTNSSWNHIELNSRTVVKDACRRRTISNHELFHRVQYSYGYITGTANMKWMTEGTASWSQKFNYDYLRDYMARMNSGLLSPDVNLFSREYDACHFWVYLQQRTGTYLAIRDAWGHYETNGKNAKAAVGTVLTTRLGAGWTFDSFVQVWHRANIVKDLTSPGTNYDYTEDEVTRDSCGIRYGPLSHVPRTLRNVANNNTVVDLNGSVSAYGADYYRFTLGAGLTRFKIVLDGEVGRNFSYHLVFIKDNVWKVIYNSTLTDKTWDLNLTAGFYNQAFLIVTGRSLGGTYTIRVGP